MDGGDRSPVEGLVAGTDPDVVPSQGLEVGNPAGLPCAGDLGRGLTVDRIGASPISLGEGRQRPADVVLGRGANGPVVTGGGPGYRDRVVLDDIGLERANSAGGNLGKNGEPGNHGGDTACNIQRPKHGI